MAIDSDSFIILFPEFEDENSSRIDTFIEYAADYVNSSVWGSKYDYAHGLFTAHMMASSAGSSVAGGPVQSEKVGDLSRTYAVSSSDSESLASTSYGRLFLQLRKTLLISPIITD